MCCFFSEQAALIEHTNRALYQASIWTTCLKTQQDPPNPQGFGWTEQNQSWRLKSVRVHFAYGRIALTLELLGRFGQFLDVIALPFFSYLFRGSSGSKSKVHCIAISKVWTTGMLVAGEGPPDKTRRSPYPIKGHTGHTHNLHWTTPPN